MKYLRIFTVVFINFLFLLLPIRIAIGCGPQLFFDGYSFINPNIIDQKSAYAPYFYSFNDFYEHFEKTKEIQVSGNLEEWKDIFCDQISIKAIGDLIYKTSISDIKLLKTAVKNKKYPLSPRLNKNAFARHLKTNRCHNTIDYLIFAKECEPHVSYYDPWEGTAKRDTFRMQELIEKGLKEFQKSKSNYIKLRYAYQLIRLAHYKQNYAQTLELYEYLIPKFDPVESILNYWIMGHRAGAIMKRGDHVQASYLYSLIFEIALVRENLPIVVSRSTPKKNGNKHYYYVRTTGNVQHFMLSERAVKIVELWKRWKKYIYFIHKVQTLNSYSSKKLKNSKKIY